MNNYGPISILTRFSNIIKKHSVCEIKIKIKKLRLSSFFKKQNVTYKNQYSFQNNISTTHAMLDVVTSYSGLAFVDVKKHLIQYHIIFSRQS